MCQCSASRILKSRSQIPKTCVESRSLSEGFAFAVRGELVVVPSLTVTMSIIASWSHAVQSLVHKPSYVFSPKIPSSAILTTMWAVSANTLDKSTILR